MSDKVNLDQIKFDRHNANKGSVRGRGQIEASLREFGFADAGTLDKNNTIIGGNKRTEVAGEIGMDEVIIIDVDGTKPVFIRRPDLDLNDPEDDRARRLAYALNRSQEVSLTWDTEVLFADMQNGLDLSSMWNEDEMSELFAEFQTETTEPSDAEAQIDKADELLKVWQVQPGDLWRIGEHVIICGDCRDSGNWAKLLSAAGVKSVNGVFTSPPYAMQRKDQYGGVPTDEYVEWWDALQANFRVYLADDGSVFVNIKAHCEDGQRVLYCMDLVCAMVRRWRWRYEDEFAWVHGGTPMDVERRFKNGFEPIYHFSLDYNFKFNPKSVMHDSDSVPGEYGKKKRGRIDTALSQGKTGDIFANPESGPGLAYPSNALRMGKNTEAWGQAAAFPVALPDFFIRAYSDPGDIWIDPFCGSGTTLVAAQNNNRRGLGFEMLPKYCSVILQRMQDAFPDLVIEKVS